MILGFRKETHVIRNSLRVLEFHVSLVRKSLSVSVLWFLTLNHQIIDDSLQK